MIKEKLAKLIDLKTIITLLMVVTLVILMFFTPEAVDGDIKTLFCTSFGMVITYYFTKKKDA